MEIGIIFISLDIPLPNHQFPRRNLTSRREERRTACAPSGKAKKGKPSLS